MLLTFFEKMLITLKCARVNYWIKNIFILPGFIITLTIEGITKGNLISSIMAIFKKMFCRDT